MNTFNKMWGVFTPDEARKKIKEQVEEAGITENASLKIHDILSKIVNKGKSNVIAIVL